VPGVATDALQFDIRDDRTRAKRLAGEIDAQRVPHEAAAAIGADEIACAHDFAPDLRGDAFGVLREAGQFPAKLRLVAEFGETLAHHGFGEELRHHQGRAIWLGWRRIGGVAQG
jgi:hypothetical protein